MKYGCIALVNKTISLINVVEKPLIDCKNDCCKWTNKDCFYYAQKCAGKNMFQFCSDPRKNCWDPNDFVTFKLICE